MNTKDAALWLALKLVPRLSIHKKLSLAEAYGLEELFTLDRQALLSMGLTDKQAAAISTPDKALIDRVITQTQAASSVLITYGSSAYPKQLKEIYDPPLVLWVKGNTELLASRQIALVGSRAATPHGMAMAKQLASQLSKELTITSGLAIGVDGASHQGALEANGPTIAVVGTGINRMYPARHKKLARQIIESDGAIVSEFLPDTPAKPGHFPRRNRIISGLSLATVIVEAEIKSGSLITAKFALEHNRDVFAVPGSPLNPMAKGGNFLIKQGAKLIETAADIMEELGISTSSSFGNSLGREATDKSVKIHDKGLLNDSLLASVDYEITPVDIVVSRCKLPTDEVLTRLTMLELRGLVSAVPGGYLRLHRG